MAEYLRCKDGFVASPTDKRTTRGRVVKAGQVVASNDPIVKGREAHFETFEVEAATAAPGELRAGMSRERRVESGAGNGPQVGKPERTKKAAGAAKKEA